jgi:SAM-dependent methyltransferase
MADTRRPWERDEVLRDIVEWDTANWSRAITFWERHTQQDLGSVRALEVGCGNGGLSLWIALHGGQCLCTDVEGPRPMAVEKHRRFGVESLIRYAPLDATAMTYENEFDVVLFKSVLGGVGHHGRKDRQRKALDAIYRALKPGGELLFAENLVASPLHRLMREQFTSWGDYWCYMTADELTSCMDSYANIDMKLVGFLGAFGRTETQRRMLGSLDIAFVERAVPRAWRYLAFGVARK